VAILVASNGSAEVEEKNDDELEDDEKDDDEFEDVDDEFENDSEDDEEDDDEEDNDAPVVAKRKLKMLSQNDVSFTDTSVTNFFFKPSK